MQHKKKIISYAENAIIYRNETGHIARYNLIKGVILWHGDGKDTV